MNLEWTVFNGFWFLIPILAWNLVFASKITQEEINSDAYSPAWLLGAENIFRMISFVLPLVLAVKLESGLGQIGLGVYGAGCVVYFASWVPLMRAPQSAWSESIPGLFAPRLTPYAALLGIALMTQSWLYGILAGIFIFLHTWHGVQNLRGINKSQSN
jgi:hypothetical protein